MIDALSDELRLLVRDTLQPAHVSYVVTSRHTTERKRRARVGSLAQRLIRPVGGSSAHARYPVGVPIEGDLDRSVPGELLDALWVHAASKQNREAGMP